MFHLDLTELDHQELEQDIRRSLAMSPLERIQWLEEVQMLIFLSHGTLDVPLRHEALEGLTAGG